MTILALLIGLVAGTALGALAIYYLWARTALAARDQLRDQERVAAAERLALVERGHEQWEARIKAATGDALTRSQTSLLELTEAKLAPINAEMRRLLADPAEIDSVLKKGAERASAVAAPVMDAVKRKVGFIG